MKMLVIYQWADIIPSKYQSDANCTEFDHEIYTRSNLRQKPLEDLNSNASGSEGDSTSDLGAKHQTSETFPKHQI